MNNGVVQAHSPQGPMAPNGAILVMRDLSVQQQQANDVNDYRMAFKQEPILDHDPSSF